MKRSFPKEPKLPSSPLSAAANKAASAAEYPAPAAELPTIVQVTEALPDLEALLAAITLKTSGGACLFAGLVRGETGRDQPHQTLHLDYEAYVPMAEAKLAQVAAEMRERWPAVEGIAICHRIGTMAVGVPIVYVACTAAHRDTGIFDAARYGIDRLKEIVPIWKKEVGPQGEVWVEGDYHPQAGE
jgi:molybdopterin synthase catalytic subunit